MVFLKTSTVLLAIAMLSMVPRPAGADETSTTRAPAAKTFRELLDRRQRETLQSVGEYVAGHPDADDAEAASLWMFETALAQGLEAEVIAPAEQFLKRRGLDQPSVSLAQQALCVGLARKGKPA